MSQPPRPHLCYIFNPGNVRCSVADLVDDLRLYTVKEAGEDGLAGLPNDDENRRGDDKAYDGVSEWVAQPHAPGSEKDSKAGPTIRSRVVSVRDKGGAVYLPTHPDAKDGHGFVADEADQCSDRHRPQESYGLRVKEPLDSLVPCDYRTEDNDEYNDHARQVFHPTVAEREAPACTQAGEREGKPQRYGGCGITEVVDSVR